MCDDEILVPTLQELCLAEAASSNLWTVQKRSLEMLPEHAADALLSLIVRFKGLTSAHQLELFWKSAACLHLSDLPSMQITGEHLAYISGFKHLRYLDLSHSPRLRDSHLAILQQLPHPEQLMHLDLSVCRGITEACISNLTSTFTDLRSLDLSYSGQPSNALYNGDDASLLVDVSRLTHLTSLKLAYLGESFGVLSDRDLAAWSSLLSLKHLDFSGAGKAVSESGLLCMQKALTGVTYLNVSQTAVTLLPLLPCLQVLYMEGCLVNEVWKVEGSCPLAELHLKACTLACPYASGEGWSPVKSASSPTALHRALAMCAPTIVYVDTSQSPFCGLHLCSQMYDSTISGWDYVDPNDCIGEEELHVGTSDDDDCHVTAVDTPIRGSVHLFPKLKVLDLRCCFSVSEDIILKDLLFLRSHHRFPSLNTLRLNEYPLGTCTSLPVNPMAPALFFILRDLNHLRVLDVSSCNLGDVDIEHLKQLTALQELDLSCNYHLTGAIVSIVPTSAAAIPNAGMEGQPSSSGSPGHQSAPFEVEGAYDSDGSKQGWARMKNMRSLSLVNTAFGLKGLRALAQGLGDSLQKLSLGFLLPCHQDNHDMGQIGGQLNNSIINDKALMQLSALTKLTCLSIQSCSEVTTMGIQKLLMGWPAAVNKNDKAQSGRRVSMRCVGGLPCLRQLEVPDCTGVSKQFLKKLIGCPEASMLKEEVVSNVKTYTTLTAGVLTAVKQGGLYNRKHDALCIVVAPDGALLLSKDFQNAARVTSTTDLLQRGIMALSNKNKNRCDQVEGSATEYAGDVYSGDTTLDLRLKEAFLKILSPGEFLLPVHRGCPWAVLRRRNPCPSQMKSLYDQRIRYSREDMLQAQIQCISTAGIDNRSEMRAVLPEDIYL
ncbi:hypothetical protein CEUSTIGMA_g11012.t1 [Chlamydomonas eustigma]|uniref:Uncharacterized protein n=1 Tax=Chlamydomonas eustigma TaxID=1157962 RepID=A0A250XKK3_9CHLO|nr:hypothetical protein CEUSTIGMA_g11012.t1 [Chlamydomonas eustigma]|eukprot:GAX83587.1 hypothetical protein CEUSTIGMA_g11012.t1 [Chlamydomonas eustigma]